MTAFLSGGPAAVGAARSKLRGSPSPDAADIKYGVTTWFRITVDDGVQTTPLGEWSTCTGIQVKIGNEAVKDGINLTAPRIVPTVLEYPPITLERAVSKPESLRVQKWLRRVVERWVQAGDGAAPETPGFLGVEVQIDLYAAPQGPGQTSGVPVRTWTLHNAYPVAWEGPSLNSDSGGIATEKLTLAHRGFLADAPDAGGASREGLLKLTDASGDSLELQYQPDSVTMNKSMNFKTAADKSLGVNPGKLSFGFTVRLNGESAVEDARKKLYEWLELDTRIISDVEEDKAKVLVLRIGSNITNRVRLRSVNTTFSRFSASGAPCRAEFVLSLEEKLQNEKTAHGSLRGGAS